MSALAALAADATGAAVPPVDVAASAAASDDTAPADESRAPTAPLIDAAEGIVPLVAGAAAGTVTDAAPADDAGASATAFDDTTGKTRVPVTAASAGAAAASATAVGADCCDPSAADIVCFGGCCHCPFDRENISISISFDWRHSTNAESEITTVSSERIPLGGCSRRWWRARKGSPLLANDAVVSGSPDNSETSPP